MSPENRMLAALAAVFFPARAEPLLRSLAGKESEEAAALAGELARKPRAERLAALAQALARRMPDARRIESWLEEERLAVANVARSLLPPELRRGGARATSRPVSLLLVRLCAERIAAALR